MARGNGEWSDFVLDFMGLTSGAPSPRLFKLWSAITLVAGALERRVWIRLRDGNIYPNLYTLLVGPPGTGKFIIEHARQLWTEALEPGTKLRAFRVAPDSMTKASLMDTLAKARQSRIMPSGPPLTYNALLIAAEEFGVLLPDYDTAYIASLNAIFNGKDLHEEVRRTGSVKELRIENPLLCILGGVQPSYLASTFPEEAWASGISRRLIMVYASDPPEEDLFIESAGQAEARARLLAKLGQISQLTGLMAWAPEAFETLQAWHRDRAKSEPGHSKLVHYCRTRTVFVAKLAMISAVARTGHLLIQPVDIRRADEWLREAEGLMPDIFRAMVGKSDSQVIEELHYFVTAMWAKARQKPVPGRLLWNFLAQRVPSDKIERIIQTADRAGVVVRSGGSEDLWVPRPRDQIIGVE